MRSDERNRMTATTDQPAAATLLIEMRGGASKLKEKLLSDRNERI